MAISSIEPQAGPRLHQGMIPQDSGVVEMLPLLCEVRPERSSPRQERKQIEWCFWIVSSMSESLNGAYESKCSGSLWWGAVHFTFLIICAYVLHKPWLENIFLRCWLSKLVRLLRTFPVSLIDTVGLRLPLGLPFPLNPRGASHDVQNSLRFY